MRVNWGLHCCFMCCRDSELDAAAGSCQGCSPTASRILWVRGAARAILGVLPGAGSASGWGMTTAWGSSCLTAKFPLHFRHYDTDFPLAKAPALQTGTTLTAGKLVGCLGAKVKLKYISKCLQDQDLIQA